VASDTRASSVAVCEWVPERTQEYRIVVKNADRYTVDFRLCTN
jgi:hypothetical protein